MAGVVSLQFARCLFCCLGSEPWKEAARPSNFIGPSIGLIFKTFSGRPQMWSIRLEGEKRLRDLVDQLSLERCHGFRLCGRGRILERVATLFHRNFCYKSQLLL